MKYNKSLMLLLSLIPFATSALCANSILITDNSESNSSKSDTSSKEGQDKYISNDSAQFYIGAGVAAGRIDAGTSDILTSYLLEPLASLAFSTQVKSGGFSWKGYAGATACVNKYIYMGAEVGYSWYPETRVTFNVPNLEDLTEALDISGSVLDGGFRFKGFGIDLLYNTTFKFSDNFYFGLKPGFQFAYQNSKFYVDSNIEDLMITLNTKYRTYKFLPQIVLDTGYEFNKQNLGSWDMKKVPFFVDIYYQHVFGNDDSSVNKRVSSRDALGGSFGIKF